MIVTYCDGFGVSYATTFQIHGTSDMNVATQRSGTKVNTSSIILHKITGFLDFFHRLVFSIQWLRLALSKGPN
jgi:hypothetical protein